MTDAFERDLGALVAKHADLTGREFVAACLRVAAGYFEPGDLPELCDMGMLAEALRRELAA